MPTRDASGAAPVFAETPARWWMLAAVECGHFVVYMDAFIVTQALPTMAAEFGVDIHDIKWVLVAYLAALTMTLLLAGRLADRWGRKRITILGAVLMSLAAAFCAIAPTLQTLILFRILQGLGGALVLANVMAEITAIFPRDERRRAMAVNASVLAMSQVAGLVLGGYLIDSLGWRSIFVLVAVIGAMGVALDMFMLRNRASKSGERLDWWGAGLSILVVGVPFLFVERLSFSFLDPLGGAVLLGGLLLLGLFVVVERNAAWPLLNLQLFRSRGYTFGIVASAFYFIVATFGYLLMPLYAQIVLGMTPLAAGLLLVPMSLALTITSEVVGQWSSKLSARLVSTAGLLCVSGAVFGMSLLGEHPATAYVVSLVILAGAGGGLFHPPNNVAVLSGVPTQDLGSANGFFTAARSFGQAIGAALAAALLNHGLREFGALHVLRELSDAATSSHVLEAYVEAQTIAFRAGAALGLVGAVISALRGADSATKPAERLAVNK